MNRHITIAAVAIVIGFGIFSIMQVFNIPLAVMAVASLVYLFTGKQVNFGIAAAAIAMIFAYMLAGQLLLLEVFFLAVLPAIIIAVCVRAGKAPDVTVLYAVSPALIISLIFLIGLGPTEELFQRQEESLRQSFRDTNEDFGLLERFEVSEEEYREIEDSSLAFIKLLFRFGPALLMISFTLIAALGYMLASYFIEKEGRYIRRFPKFTAWKINERMLIAFGVALLAVILANGLVEDIGENAALYIMVLFSFAGLSLMESFLQKKKVGVLPKIIVYVCLVLLHFYGALIMAAAGLLDSHFDFRRLRAAQIG